MLASLDTPTLLDAAGLPIPEQVQGCSVLPLAQKTATDWPDEAFIQISEAQVGRAVRTQHWKYCVDAPDKHGVHDAGSDTYVEQYLYDLEYDPYELTNLVANESHARVRDVMRERLIRCMTKAGEAAPTILPIAETIPAGQRIVTEAEALS